MMTEAVSLALVDVFRPEIKATHLGKGGKLIDGAFATALHARGEQRTVLDVKQRQ